MKKASFNKEQYSIIVDDKGVLEILKNNQTFLKTPALVRLDPLKAEPETSSSCSLQVREVSEGEAIVLDWSSSHWIKKQVTILCMEDRVEISAVIEGRGQSLDRVLFFPEPGTTGITRCYAPRFDWSRGKVHFPVDESDSLSCHQWLSPPPFYYGLQWEETWMGAGLAVEPGDNRFLSFDYSGAKGPEFQLTYEGHTRVKGEFRTPALILFMNGTEEENSGLFQYTEELVKRGCTNRNIREIPRWWKEPIFCGWGQQRLEYRRDHDGHEMGSWINAGDYSTQVFYERSLSVLEEKNIHPGIVIIDCFWAQHPAMAQPHPFRWPDMRKFIDNQHDKGRKVLLWLTPIICEHLPREMCMTVDGRPIAADPTSPVFREFFSEEIRKMVSPNPDCLNADGFKIDFTQNIPAERGVFRNYLTNRWGIISEKAEKNYPSIDEREELVQLHGNQWGVELIKAYLTAVREPMKKTKADSLLITHTANPYFAEEVDMLRLNDMDGTSPDVLGIMSNRADIARSCHPAWLIDTDNDLMINKEMWRKYIALQPLLGNPDTYYATGIAQSGEDFDQRDYELLRKVFREYREGL